MVSRNSTDNVTTPILLTILTRDRKEPEEELRNGVAGRVRELEFQLVIGEHGDNDAVAIFGMLFVDW